MKQYAKNHEEQAELYIKKAKLKQILKTCTEKETKQMIQNELANIDQLLKKTSPVKRMQKLEDLKELQTIKYEQNKVTIKTKDIMLRQHNIGKYLIRITNHEVRIKRCDGITINGCSHHFVSESIPCFGIWAPTITDAIYNKGYYTIALASLKLLRTWQGHGFLNPNNFLSGLKYAKKHGEINHEIS